MDREAETGSVNTEMDMHSIDFGFEAMTNSAKDHVVLPSNFLPQPTPANFQIL